MSEENVEMVRRSYAAYNAAVNAPNPREAIRAALARFADPAIEWELDRAPERVAHRGGLFVSLSCPNRAQTALEGGNP
jgi:hypothetical protein